MNSTLSYPISLHPFEPLSQRYTDWSLPSTYNFASWRHELPRSWYIPPPAVPCNQRLVLPPMYTPELECPSSPSESCSSARTDPSPPPQFIQVVCNVPIVVPKPRPFKRITPLDFDLPNEDQDLSHPPYTTRASSKRKRSSDDDEPAAPRAKRNVKHAAPVPVSRPLRVSRQALRNLPIKPR